MMSYNSTVAVVKSLFRNFEDVTNPEVTDTDIQTYLDDAKGIIDAKIGTLYTLPLVSPDNDLSIAVLATIEKYMAADVVDDILNTYADTDKRPEWGKKAMLMLKALVPPYDKTRCKQCEPTMKLPDATYNGTSVQRGRISVSATTGTQFQKGVDSW